MRYTYGVKLGFTAFLIADDPALDVLGICEPHLPSELRSTQPTVFSDTISRLTSFVLQQNCLL